MTTVALCGAGMIAGAHAAAAAQLGHQVVAVASRTSARAAAIAQPFGARVVDFADLPAGADMVVVATPPQCHADDAVRMLEAGAIV
ncbi:MAG: Gfo/Idh/MocA family oxidoreductase, partial [Actinomycetota bacterium]